MLAHKRRAKEVHAGLGVCSSLLRAHRAGAARALLPNDMIVGLAVLFGFALGGEALSRALHLPVPGTVTGMAALAVTLLLVDRHRREREETRGFASLSVVAGGLIASMGVMFVPAGVGVITQIELLRRQWLPITVALAASTWLSLLVTGWVMSWALRRLAADAPDAAAGEAR